MSNAAFEYVEETTFDAARAEAFAGKMLGVLNDASLAILISIGHQTRLFDTMASLPAATSEEIAGAAGLNERYVREWLGGVTVGGVVTYDRESKRYSLPAEHAASLTRAAGTDNFGTFMQYIALAGEVEQGIIDCFQNGGGLPYSAYPRFGGVQADESRQTVDATLLQKTLPLDRALVERLRQGIDVAEIGCGHGHAANVMARAFPKSRFSAFDFSTEAINAARAEARAWGLTNIRFEVRDVSQLDAESEFDLVTAFDTIHDQARPRQVLREVARALRPDGVFLMVDIAASSDVADNVAHPLGPMLYFISVMHCMSVSLSVDGEGLGTVWGEQKAVELLVEAGFSTIDIKRVEGDIMNSYYFVRK
jgi:2-polyprenyl-3-methyl-5-hydroxy-6-metoxy-1,4-benzoquinol methylase